MNIKKKNRDKIFGTIFDNYIFHRSFQTFLTQKRL